MRFARGGAQARVDKVDAALAQDGPLAMVISATAEEVDAIEDVYEPFLIQLGFLQRTPRRLAIYCRLATTPSCG